MNTLLKTSIFTLLLVASLGAAADVHAAEVRAGISTRETYVGMPVTFQVRVDNAKDFDPPTVPEIPGLRIQSVGTPARSTQTTIVNGNVTTRSSVTYSYSLTPTQPGNFRIPTLQVQADGQTLTTPPFEFVASKSETGDLLFVEIAGKEKEIYVGQSLDLTLRIWVRPYRDQEHGITLSEGDMWQLLSQRTNWGPFADRIQAMADNGQRPVGTEVLRADRDGAKHSYYLYEIDATIYPKKPGRIDADDVQVIVLYPTAIGESRDPFARFFDDMGMPGGHGGMFTPFAPRLTIESARPIVAEAKVEPIDVKEIPIANRPADYRGAVGKYRIVAQASPTDVKAGDPINLVLQITGTGPLDLVQAPPLADLASLDKDFKVPNEPLAGYVDGGRKLFGTTIRPRKEGITQIPPIPFTYFDPEVGKFVTTHSKPIEIKVAPAEMLALDDVVGNNKSASATRSAAAAGSNQDGPILANLTGNELLAQQSSPAALGSGLWIALALPPVVVLGLLLARSRSGIAFVAGRFRSANRAFTFAVESAKAPADVSAALRQLLRQRLRLSRADDSELAGTLRANGHRKLAVRCERLLQQDDSDSAAAFANAPSLAELKQSAVEIANELQTERRPTPRKVTSPARRLSPTTTAIVAAAMLFSTADYAQADEASNTALTLAQQQTILAEATERYETARQSAANDSAEAKEAFADAAQKYQLLVDAGVRNAGLYFNLGNAYLESGATARAIANYHRAIALDPTAREARTNLAFAEKMLKSNTQDSAAVDASWVEQVAVINDLFNRFVSPRTVLAIAMAAWFAFWIALGLRLLELHIAWKSVAAVALAVGAITATSYFLTSRSLGQASVVVITPDAELRTADGTNFPAVSGGKVNAGQRIAYLRERGDWVQVRTPSGQTGWLPGDAVEVL